MGMLLYVGTVLAFIAVGHGARACEDGVELELEFEGVHMVLGDMDLSNSDGIVQARDLMVFYGHIMGLEMDNMVDVINDMEDDQILTLLANLEIPRSDFAVNWNERYGNSVAYAEAFFDEFDENGDELHSEAETEEILHFLTDYYDISGDGELDLWEMEEYLLSIIPC